MGTPIIPCSNSAPVFQSAEHDFYLMSLLIKLFIIRDWFFPATPARNARSYSFVEQGLAEPVGIIATIRQQFSGLGQRVEQDGGAFIIAHLTGGQMERYRLAGGIANGVKF